VRGLELLPALTTAAGIAGGSGFIAYSAYIATVTSLNFLYVNSVAIAALGGGALGTVWGLTTMYEMR